MCLLLWEKHETVLYSIRPKISLYFFQTCRVNFLLFSFLLFFVSDTFTDRWFEMFAVGFFGQILHGLTQSQYTYIHNFWIRTLICLVFAVFVGMLVWCSWDLCSNETYELHLLLLQHTRINRHAVEQTHGWLRTGKFATALRSTEFLLGLSWEGPRD